MRVKIENKGLSLLKKVRISGKFLKSKVFAISASAIMVSIIMVIMSMAQTIINFDAGRILQEEMAKAGQQSLLLNKVVSEETQKLLDRTYRVPVYEGDVQALYDAGYKGKVYPIYNVTVPITSSMNAAGVSTSYFGNSIYMTETFGTMIVDEAFLESKFGDVKYHAKLDKFNPGGVIITDYVADAIITYGKSAYSGQDYSSLLGEVGNMEIKRNFINAIIDTGYRERYKEFLDKVSNGEFESNAEIYEDPAFLNLSNEIYDNLGYSYSANPNFVSDYKQEFACRFPWLQKLMINDVLQYSQEYFIVFGATQNRNMLYADWAYTFNPPQIPSNAKYMRVAFGITNSVSNVSNPGNPLLKQESATLRFSNGYSPTVSQLNYIRGYWLNPSTGEPKLVDSVFHRSCLSDYIRIPAGTTITKFGTYAEKTHAFCAFYDENKNFISSYVPGGERVDLPSKTIHMGYNQYNALFGTDYTAATVGTFKPHKITLTQYRHTDAAMESPLFTVEVTIGALRSQGGAMFASQDVIDLFLQNEIYANALYLDGTDGIAGVLKLTDELNYEHQSIAVEGIHTMTKAVDVFVPIFELVAIFLCLGVVFILVNFASKMIKDKMHEIGILKALGTKNGTIVIIFGLQVFLVALLTILLSTIGYYFFIDFANGVLFQSMQQLVPKQVVLNLDFFVYMPKVAVMNGILIFALSTISLITPMLKIKAIKPVKIIKAKE